MQAKASQARVEQLGALTPEQREALIDAVERQAPARRRQRSSITAII
jgi:hypothetical protein